MYWIILAVLAGITSNLSNFFSRYLLKGDEDATVYAWFFELSRFTAFIMLAIFDFHLLFTFQSILFLLAMGLVEFISIYVYMKQHAYSHLSISTIISRTRLIWIPIIAFLFLGEHLPASAYIGIIILFIGLSIVKAPHKLFADKGMRYAYLSAFLVAVVSVMMKQAESFASPSLLLVFLAMPTTFLFPLLIKKPKERFTTFFNKSVNIKILAGIVNVASVYLYTVALKSGSVSIVSAIYHGALVVSVIAGIIFLKEREDIGKKLLGTVIALIGILFLTIL